MRPAIISLQVGLPHLLIWIAIVALLVAGYFVFRKWRRRHPKAARRQTTYSASLERRLANARTRDKRLECQTKVTKPPPG